MMRPARVDTRRGDNGDDDRDTLQDTAHADDAFSATPRPSCAAPASLLPLQEPRHKLVRRGHVVPPFRIEVAVRQGHAVDA